MDEFNCYVTEFNSESANIHVQSIWNDNIYSKYIESIKGRIGYIYTTDPSRDYDKWLDSKTDNNNKDKLNTKKNYGNAYDVIHNTLSIGYTVEEGENVSVSIIPYLEVNDGEYKYKILYDQFTTVLSLNPSEYTTNEIAKNIFNYYVNNKYLTLSYDVDSKINSEVKYEISRLTEDGKEVVVASDTWEDINYMGQNIAIIEYIDGSFDKEDVYWLKLWLNKSDEKAKADFEAPIYVSEVSNYYHRLYDHY